VCWCSVESTSSGWTDVILLLLLFSFHVDFPASSPISIHQPGVQASKTAENVLIHTHKSRKTYMTYPTMVPLVCRGWCTVQVTKTPEIGLIHSQM
jgi:hypothetical protein